MRANTASLNGKGNISSRPDPFPIIVAEWDRNGRGEVVRVALDQYNGRNTINARIWYRNADDDLRPGKSGLTLSVKHLPALAEALRKAVREAEAKGLLDAEGV